MSKNNLDNVDKKHIETLKKDLEDKISNKDEFIKADNLYGLFVSNNTFIIAKGTTKKHKYCTTYLIENFISRRLICYGVVENTQNSKAPWENKIMTIKNSDLKAIPIPIKGLLGRHVKNGVTTMNRITSLYETVNEYVMQNPSFINEMFREIEESKHI